jgi:hypothetical protein
MNWKIVAPSVGPNYVVAKLGRHTVATISRARSDWGYNIGFSLPGIKGQFNIPTEDEAKAIAQDLIDQWLRDADL